MSEQGKIFDFQFIVNRAKAVITNPKDVWGTIQSEQDTIKGIYLKYLIPLAAVGAICGYIRQAVIGINFPLIGTWRAPFFQGLFFALFQFIIGLGAIYIFALILDFLAENFGGKKSLLNAFKLVAYSMTPHYLATILFAIIVQPVILIICLGLVLGLYGLYILYQGVETMIGVPREKRVGYIVVTFVVALVLMLFIVPLVSKPFMPTPPMPTFPGIGNIGN